MRNLTKKQKNLLTKWNKENSLNNVGDLTDEQFKTLEKINDNELLYQNVNRFIMDLAIKEIYVKSNW
jgi:hypothetical protein